MSRELITTPSAYKSAVSQLLAMAVESIWIFDQDLADLNLDGNSQLERLGNFLKSPANTSQLRICVRDDNHVRRTHPRLMQLLATYGHRFSAQQCSLNLSHLRDAMILVDGRHGLVRFDQEQPRSKLLIDEPDELRPYCQRFEEIWREQGETISATTLGL
jgi:hypothetical protein